MSRVVLRSYSLANDNITDRIYIVIDDREVRAGSESTFLIFSRIEFKDLIECILFS